MAYVEGRFRDARSKRLALVLLALLCVGSFVRGLTRTTPGPVEGPSAAIASQIPLARPIVDPAPALQAQVAPPKLADARPRRAPRPVAPPPAAVAVEAAAEPAVAVVEEIHSRPLEPAPATAP